MIRRHPRPTRTDTLFPHTTLFRSDGAAPVFGRRIVRQFQPVPTSNTAPVLHGIADGGGPIIPGLTNTPTCRTLLFHCLANRSEERRVGEECVSTCRSRWLPYHSNKKNTQQRDQE